MQKKFRWTARLAGAAPAALVLAGVMVGSVPARAADGDSIWNFDKKLWDGLRRGLGLQGADDENINYRERSPLVIPSSNELPPPRSTSPAQANANWPTDPDVKARRDRKKAEAEDYGNDPDHWGDRLSPSELNKGRVRGNSQRKEVSDFDRAIEALSPSELGYNGGLFGMFKKEKKDEVATFKEEPPRTVLTEPPPGLQTPSPAYPYGSTKRVEYGPAEKHDRQLDSIQ